MDMLAYLSPDRAVLLARLAAERAYLLQRLEGLDEATLTHDSVFDGWTVAALLAHLAYWDALEADRLGKLADGRPGDIEPPGVGADTVDAHNAALQRRFAGLPFSQGLALCQKENRSLMLALDRLPDALLFGRARLRPGWRATPATWLRRRARHDAGHAADLARWRAGYPPNDRSVRVIHRDLLRPLVGQSRAELLALIALIPPDARQSQAIEGEWSLPQVLGHISDYDRLGVLALQRLAAGQTPDDEQTFDIEAYNVERGPFWTGVTLAEAWAQFVATRRALLALAATLDDATLARPFTAPWGAPTTACGYLLDMAGHDGEHADALRRSLGLPALPRRLIRGAG